MELRISKTTVLTFTNYFSNRRIILLDNQFKIEKVRSKRNILIIILSSADNLKNKCYTSIVNGYKRWIWECRFQFGVDRNIEN